MLDTVLIPLIIQVLIAGEATMGIAGTPVKAAFQPTQQGVPTQPSIFIYKVSDHRYGSMLREDIWDTNTGQMTHIESQQYESKFQISTLATQNPKTPTQLTASDIANYCAAILQSSVALQTFQANGVGIERITDVLNPNFSDDRARNEYNPSFDFVLTHKQIITTTTPIIDEVDFAVYEI